jgi:hypothetical protein
MINCYDRLGSSGAAQTLSTTLHFPSPVRHVMPAISGFKIEYVKEDHELGEMTIDTVTTSTARRLMSPFAPSF